MGVFSAISSKLPKLEVSNKHVATLDTYNSLEELDNNSLDSDLDLVDPDAEDGTSLDLGSNKEPDSNLKLDNYIDLESNLESNPESNTDSSTSKGEKIVFNKNTNVPHGRVGHSAKTPTKRTVTNS